jgi:iron-sulfur cluster assembly protein
MIQLSLVAVNELKRLQRKHQQTASSLLRLDVQQGGCSGLSYDLSFVGQQQPGDQMFESNGIAVVISSDSLPYLQGLLIDYSEDLMGGGFRFQNPNAQQTCGCGHSFAIASIPTSTLAGTPEDCASLGFGI